MGRKIPAKKHRGVKDPLAQQARRLQSIKNKINAPPKDPDEQPVPQSLTRLFSFQNPKPGIKGTKKKRKPVHNQANSSNGHKTGRNPISKMQRLPGESGRSFSLRINEALRALNDVDDEQLQYPHDIEAEDAKGAHMDDLRRRRERKRKRAPASSSENTGVGDTERALSRSQRRALKLKAKKLKRTEAAGPPLVQYERVSFGDVAHAPPALAPRRRRGGNDPASRPGRRDLLLSALLNPGSRPAPGARSAPGTRPAPGAGSVPAAELRRRERARQDAVDAYRALKKQQARNT